MTSQRSLPLTIAISEYDHVRDLLTGRSTAPGIDLTWLEMPVEEIFQRFATRREWEVSEFSFALYIALRTSGDTGLTAIPVFPSRMFRHAAIFVRPGTVSDASQLAGRRIGIPEWAQTAGVWARGILSDHHGVRLTDVDWVRGGVSKPGRTDRVPLSLPEGLSVTEAAAGRCLQDMLADGELDAVITAHAPSRYDAGDPSIVRLYEDWRSAEYNYFAKTGVYPVMHLVVVRSDVIERHPWVPRNLMLGFEQARARSMERLRDMQVSRIPLPWLGRTADELAAASGHDWFPYGVEANRPTLEAFCRYAYEQGVAHTLIEDVSTLFDPSATFDRQN